MTLVTAVAKIAQQGRYRVVESLGQGACGDVFLVEDSAEPPKLKALKLLRANLARPLVETFRTEFRILASLEHPSLARVYEFGSIGEEEYYTTEYVAGRELGQLSGDDWRDVCRALASVCRALAYVHARGYVHNDVKPSNVVVADGYQATKLLDFGLAGLDRAASSFVYGTPGYLAPERLLGRAWDYRADLYSLGATAYRVFAGRRPTEETESRLALAALRAGVPSLGQLRPDLPPALSALVDCLLAFEPEARPRHPFDVVAAIGRALGEVLPLETAGAARCYALSSALVGRDEVLADVERGLAAAFAGASRRTFVIAAGPGLGKSRLLGEIVQRHETGGGRSAWVRADASTNGLAALASAATLLGFALENDPESDEPAASRQIATRQQRNPLLLAVDDAQRLPESGIFALLSLANRAARERVPLAIALAISSGELSDTTRRLLSFGVAAGEASRVDLAPLTQVQIGAMLTSLFGAEVIPGRVQEELLQRSAGNPLLLEEMVRELVDDGSVHSSRDGWKFGEATFVGARRSARLEDHLRRRCFQLPSEARMVLAGLSALGGSADSGSLRAILKDVDVQLGLSILGEHGLVSLIDDRATVAHDQTIEVGLEVCDPDHRHHLHRAAAELLAAQGDDDRAAGRAFRLAGEYPRAWHHLLRHGQAALEHGEGRAAVESLECALGLAELAGVDTTQRASATLAYAKSLSLAGRGSAAIDNALAAYATFPDEAHVERAEAAVEAVQNANRGGLKADMSRYVELAHAASRPELPLSCALAAFAESTKVHFADGGLEEAERLATLALEIVEREAPDARADDLAVRIAHARGMYALASNFARAAELQSDVLPRAQRTTDRSLLVKILNNYGYALLQQRRLDEAHEVLSQALAELEPLGSLLVMPFVLNNLAEVCQSQGDWLGADEHVRRASLVAREVDHPLPFASVARIAWRNGDPDALARAVEPYATDPRARSMHAESLIRVLVVAAAAAANRSDAATAEQLVAIAAELQQQRTWPVLSVYATLVAAYAEASRDAGAGASRLLEAAADLDRVGALNDALIVRRDAGRFFAMAGDAALARAAYEAVLEAHRAVGSGAGVASVEELLKELEPDVPSPYARKGAMNWADGPERLMESVLREAGVGVRCQWRKQGRIGTEDVSLIAREDEALVIVGGAALSDQVLAVLRALARQLQPATQVDTLGASRVQDDDAAECSRALELTLGPIELTQKHSGIVGESTAVVRAVTLLGRLAQAQVPVLITGETGTGKEVFARALHGASSCAGGPFVVVNCAAIPAQLFEAELFGYRRGAFTGAIRDHTGIIREADGGVLFLDEIGELPLPLQPKLLRALQEQTVRAIGDNRDYSVAVRVVAATNRDLEIEVSAGRFRADLYWRLNVMELALPPLRDRVSDILPLARHFLSNFDREGQVITKRAERVLLAYSWPGNIRELENVIQRASILAGQRDIEPRHFPERVTRKRVAHSAETLAERRRSDERQAISEMLRETNANLTRAAERLGLTRQGLQFKLKQLGLTREGARRK